MTTLKKMGQRHQSRIKGKERRRISIAWHSRRSVDTSRYYGAWPRIETG